MNRDNSYMQTAEFREMCRQGHLRYYALHPMSEETKAKISRSNKGKVRSSAWCKHISEAKRGKPSIEKGRPKPSSRYKRSEETRRRMSIGRKRTLSAHPGIMRSVSQKLTGQAKSKEAKQNMSRARLRYFSEHPEAGRKHGEKMKVVWTRPDYIEAVVRARNLRPNKQEITLGEIIEGVCPGQFKYNGDYSLGVVLGRYIPDFVNVNGKKQVIEFFGTYWHREEGRGEQGTIDRYKQLGWDCLVVWNPELANVSILKDKIRAFAGGKVS